MNNKRKIIYIYSILSVLAISLLFFGVYLNAGAIKNGGPYSIIDDSFTIAGAPDIHDSTYWLVFSAGQPVGQKTMSGSGYDLEGGYISGIEAVYEITKSITQVETPAGYPGSAGDIAPGARLTYRLLFTNHGEAAQTGTTILDDPIPAWLDYASGTISLTLNNSATAQTDALDGDACSYTATGTIAIHCALQNVGAGATGSVSFKAVVK
jgi:uncharacterized repeat protein (TIGR01451 family)